VTTLSQRRGAPEEETKRRGFLTQSAIDSNEQEAFSKLQNDKTVILTAKPQ